MTKKRSFLRDVNSLMKTVESVTAGQVNVLVESLEGQDGENESHKGSIQIEVAPSDGAYKGGKYKFEIYIVNDYPECPPDVRCLTEIYHPNIDTEDESDEGSNICVSLLETGEWDPNMTLEHCVQAILFLFYNPNWGDALSPLFSPDLTETEFEENVKISIEGGDIDGRYFEQNYGFSDTVTKNAEGAKLTDQEIELNSINTALNNSTIENETNLVMQIENNSTEMAVITEEIPNENISVCDADQVNIIIPTTQEVDQITPEIVGEEVEQLAEITSDNGTIGEKTLIDPTSGEVQELVRNSQVINGTENKGNTDQGEIINLDTVDNILSAMILGCSTVQNIRTDKQGGFLLRSLSVGDSPRGEKLDRNMSVCVMSSESENKSVICLGIDQKNESVCDVVGKTVMVDDAEEAHDDQQKLLPTACNGMTDDEKDPRAIFHTLCCGRNFVSCNIL